MGTDYYKIYIKIPSIPGGIGGLISSYDGTDTLYYYDSHLGNVNMITDESANIVKTYNYDAFGNVVNEMGTLEQRYLYKTKEKTYNDDLVYFGARYYDPLVDRFTTPDPMGMVDGPNRYLYCNGDPVNGVDYWGMENKCCNKDFLTCFAKCIEKYDFLNKFIDKVILTILGGPFPKSVMGVRKIPSNTRFTTILSRISLGKGTTASGKNILRIAGRNFSRAFVGYGLYLAGMESYCVGICLGDPCYFEN